VGDRRHPADVAGPRLTGRPARRRAGAGTTIVAKVRPNGTRVRYLRAENEGHGFARKENVDFVFYATVMFMRETLLR